MAVLGKLKGPLLIFLLGFYLFILAGRLDEMPVPGQLGPYFWPRAILILLMISCGIKSVEIFLARKSPASSEETLASLPALDGIKLALLIGIILGVVAAMDQLGFLLSNLIFLFLFLFLTGLRRKASLLIISAGGTVLLVYLFVKVVYLPLPKGNGPFEDLTIYLYRLLAVI